MAAYRWSLLLGGRGWIDADENCISLSDHSFSVKNCVEVCLCRLLRCNVIVSWTWLPRVDDVTSGEKEEKSRGSWGICSRQHPGIWMGYQFVYGMEWNINHKLWQVKQLCNCMKLKQDQKLKHIVTNRHLSIEWEKIPLKSFRPEDSQSFQFNIKMVRGCHKL